MEKISIVVLNFNGLNDTLDCLVSLKPISVKNTNVDVIVVDNDSHDDSHKTLSKIKWIKFIQNKDNLGYSGGNNVGIQLAMENGADYILILNNDTIVQPNFIEPLVHSARDGIASPKIYFAKGYEFHHAGYKKKDLGKVIWYAGGKIDWDNIIGSHIGVDEVDRGQFDKEAEVDFATGACMMVRSDVFKKIGLFDEKYFLYFEDADLCQRAKNSNFLVKFQPQSVISHKNAASTGGSGSQLQDYFITRNRLLFGFKYAKLRTKFALLRQAFQSIKEPQKRKALKDFLTFNFKKGSFLK